MSLREPFFLRGKQSRLVRAIWMSLALGAIGFLTGTVWFVGAQVLIFSLIGSWGETWVFLLLSGSAGVMLAAINVVYSRWLSRSATATVLRTGWIVLATTLPWLAHRPDQASPATWYVLLEEPASRLFSENVEIFPLLTVLWLAWATANIRRSPLWFVMVGASWLSVPAITLVLNSIDEIAGFFRSGLPGGLLAGLVETVAALSLGGQFFAALLVPWGIPFWTPPAAGGLSAEWDPLATASRYRFDTGREPFFLRGKHKWLIRAIWMSLALGGIGFVAGTVWFVGAQILMAGLNGILAEEWALLIFSGTAGLAFAAINIPYSRWLGRAWKEVVLRSAWLVAATSMPWLAVPFVETADTAWYDWLEGTLKAFGDIPPEYFGLFIVPWLGWSAAQFRLARSWPLMAGLSLLCVPLMMLMLDFVEQLSKLYGTWLAGQPFSQVLEMVTIFSLGGQFFAALLIPWGIPFWRPPVAGEMPDDVQDLPAQAIAITARDPLEA